MSSFLLEESCYINTLFRDLFQRLRTVTNLTTSSDLARFDLPLRITFYLPSLPSVLSTSLPPSRSLFLSLQSLYPFLSNPSSFLHFASLPSLSAPFRLFTLLPLPLYFPSLHLSTTLPFFLPSFLPSHLLFAYFACNSHFKENEQGVY